MKSSSTKIGEGDCSISGAAYTSTGAAGFANGSCSTAQFNFQPNTNSNGGGMVWDKVGNIFVADAGNHVIRKITPDCTVSTYAGTPGVSGTTDGPIASALFYAPAAIVMDSQGNLIVADRGNAGGRIRKITPSGIVSTVTTQAPIGRAGSIAIYNDVLYVTRDGFGSSAITTAHSVARVTLATGLVERFAGSGVAGFNDGTGLAAQFNMPMGITIDKFGNIYVADNGNERIRKITQAGEVSTYAGTGTRGSTDGPALTTATFASPTTVVVDAKGWVYTRGTGYYAGTYNDGRVRAITPNGEVRPFLWTNSMSNSGAQTPYGMATDNNYGVWLLQSNGASGANIYKITQ